jgi:hypothetical protein
MDYSVRNAAERFLELEGNTIEAIWMQQNKTLKGREHNQRSQFCKSLGQVQKFKYVFTKLCSDNSNNTKKFLSFQC